MRLSVFSMFAALCLLASTCVMGQSAAPTDASQFRLVPSLDKSLMDTSADACADFYQYACGNWSKQHPIPSDAPYSDQFYNLQEYNQQVLHTLLDKSVADAEQHKTMSADEQKIGDYYATCVDEKLLNAPERNSLSSAGESALQPELHRIAELQSKDDLAAYLAHAQLIGDGAFFGFGKMQDFQDATRNIAVISQGGLGLPERDYYLRTGARDQEIRDEYVSHIAKMLQLIGESDSEAKADAATIMQLETALARVSKTATELRDPKANYHYMPRRDLKKLVPTLDWGRFDESLGAPGFSYLNVSQPEFLLGLNTVLQHEDMAAIRAYLRWQLLTTVAGTATPAPLDKESFNFYGKILTGTQQQEPRWKRCTEAVDSHMGEALGKLYVEKNFPPASKAKTLALVTSVEAAMDQDIDSLDWMSAATRQQAHDKLHLIANKIGYPQKWRDYSMLKIYRGDALGNQLRAVEFENRRQLAEIGKSVDRNEWLMSPPTVNAYYDPSMNDVNFPAGILQLAFYDPSVNDALNYGHIGAIMGHEITHGFDDQGRQFDGHGNLRDWWTEEDAKKFTAKADCIVDEYSQFLATPDTHLNGKLTLGENTADNGGVRLAYLAFMAKAMQEQTHPDQKTASGFTPQQEFFLGFAQNWCSQWRPELERLVATTDPHSPDRFRANGVLVNMPEFASAFQCKAGSKMVSAHPCRVW